MNNNGVIEGLYICQQERTQQLNDRIFSRNIPSAQLQMQFSSRPVSTKYATMPILNPRASSHIPINVQPTYETTEVFNPGSSAPWSGFPTKVDDESKLRNQFFALQKCEQSEYVPSSTSDLYEVAVTSRPVLQPYPGLFQTEDFSEFNTNPCNLGKDRLYNHTRQQVKDLPTTSAQQQNKN